MVTQNKKYRSTRTNADQVNYAEQMQIKLGMGI